jgi:hypothetical protein
MALTLGLGDEQIAAEISIAAAALCASGHRSRYRPGRRAAWPVR